MPFVRLSLLLLLCVIQTAGAVTYHRGRHFYATLLGSNMKFPIFTKEFTEGPGIITVGGIRQLWLADEQQTWGLRLGVDDIRPNGAGLGASLTFWRGAFADQEFSYAHQAPWERIVRYRDPVHTFLFLDLNALVIPWESGFHALGVYSLLSLVGDREVYALDRYSISQLDAQVAELTMVDRDHLKMRFGFGLGARFYLSQRFGLWIEKRWIVGERFNSEPEFTPGGFYKTGKLKTLYAPINSLGLSLSF